MRRHFLALVLLGMLLPATSIAQVGPPAEVAVLRAGDAVRITVWRRPELSGEFTISGEGRIAHPLYREVQVTGLTLPDAETRLHDLIARYETTPQFVVEPLLRVSVGGEVRQPSLYRLPPETSIAEAVALAGGATERGRQTHVRVFRDGREVVVDLTRPEAGEAQAPIRSGDQIYVQRRVSVFRDYIAPAGSITAAAASVISLIVRNL
jgi:protein involved in polysaccharide export with SLBB domain